MTTVVFLGPSLPRSEAAVLLSADYRPPARMGDVYAAMSQGARRIVLIDGVFHSTPSVWQREILDALRDGVAVFGASSMGALRAAEMHRYGMRGHGRIFEWYRDGVISGDDEVALVHGPAELDWRPLSVPLVNVRATLGVDGPELLQIAREIPYADRTWALLAERGFAPFLDRRVDQKAMDARAVLQFVADFPHETRSEIVPGNSDLWQRERLMATRFAGGVDGRALYRAVAADGERLRTYLHRRWFALDQAGGRDADVSAFRTRWMKAWNIDGSAGWLAANGLTERAFVEWLTEEAIVAGEIGTDDFLHASWHGGCPMRDGERQLLSAWAEAHGVELAPEALIEHGPTWFGVGHHWHFAVELLRALQASGLAARYAGAL